MSETSNFPAVVPNSGPVDVSLDLYEMIVIQLGLMTIVNAVNAGYMEDLGDDFFQVLDIVGTKVEDKLSTLVPPDFVDVDAQVLDV